MAGLLLENIHISPLFGVLPLPTLAPSLRVKTGSCKLHGEPAPACCAWFHSWRWLEYVCWNCTPAVQGFVSVRLLWADIFPLTIYKVLTQALYTLYAHSTYKNKKNMKQISPSLWKEGRPAHLLHPFLFSQPGCPARRAGPTVYVLPAPWLKSEIRHGPTRVPGHAFLAWHSSWRCFVYIQYRPRPVQVVLSVSAEQTAWTVHHVQNHTLLNHSPPAS
jgi:hypothetical protein